MRICTADCCGFFIHKRCKFLYTSADGLCNHYRRVVMRFQHQGIQKIAKQKLFSLPHTEMYFRRCGCFSRCSCDRLLLSVFQCQNACHDFRCARHCHRICLTFSEQHTAGIAIHQACRRCKQLIRLALLLCRSHGHTSQKQKQDSQEKTCLVSSFSVQNQIPLVFFLFKNGKAGRSFGIGFLSASSSLYEVSCKIMVKFHKVIDTTIHIMYNSPCLYRITKLFVYFY